MSIAHSIATHSTPMACLHLALLLALIGAALVSQSRGDGACSSVTSVFNLTEPASNPAGELSAHTLLWFNSTEGAVHFSVSFLNVQLLDNTNYTLTVVGPSANFSVPGGSGGNFTVQMPSDGNGNVSLALHYNTTAIVNGGTVAFSWDINVLYVLFVNWVPSANAVVSAGPSTADYTCGVAGTANSTAQDGRQMNLGMCQCCDLGSSVHADFLTCPIVNVVTTNTNTNTTDGGDGGNGAHSISFVLYLLSLCAAVLLFVGLY